MALNWHENRERYRLERSKPTISLFWLIMAYILVLLVCGFLMAGCAAADAHDLAKDSMCGGGYTDKNGVTWDWIGKYPHCCYKPRYCVECMGGNIKEHDGRPHKNEICNEYTDEQIVEAVYKTEGGKHAQYPYGIRSISCASERSCRQICFNTVKNNKKRFSHRLKRSQDFIAFIASRYCPVKGKLSKAEIRLNGNWIKNMRYFLAKG